MSDETTGVCTKRVEGLAAAENARIDETSKKLDLDPDVTRLLEGHAALRMLTDAGVTGGIDETSPLNPINTSAAKIIEQTCQGR